VRGSPAFFWVIRLPLPFPFQHSRRGRSRVLTSLFFLPPPIGLAIALPLAARTMKVSAAGVLSFAAMLMQMGSSIIYALPLVDRSFERSSLTTQQQKQPLLAMRPERETSSSSSPPSPSINLPHILKTFPDARLVLPGAHPIVAIPDFLTTAECVAIQAWAMQAIANGATECDDYLNYRVNREIATTGQSRESQSLLDDYDGKGKDSNSVDAKLSSTDSGGFRIRVEPRVVEDLLEHKVLALLNRSATTTKFLYEEGLWHRPTPRTILVRDQTIVRYTPGDGVPPHVDGKDGTLLIYLSDGKEVLSYVWMFLSPTDY
jgi:hypothetical protein